MKTIIESKTPLAYGLIIPNSLKCIKLEILSSAAKGSYTDSRDITLTMQ